MVFSLGTLLQDVILRADATVPLISDSPRRSPSFCGREGSDRRSKPHSPRGPRLNATINGRRAGDATEDKKNKRKEPKERKRKLHADCDILRWDRGCSSLPSSAERFGQAVYHNPDAL